MTDLEKALNKAGYRSKQQPKTGGNFDIYEKKTGGLVASLSESGAWEWLVEMEETQRD